MYRKMDMNNMDTTDKMCLNIYDHRSDPRIQLGKPQAFRSWGW